MVVYFLILVPTSFRYITYLSFFLNMCDVQIVFKNQHLLSELSRVRILQRARKVRGLHNIVKASVFIEFPSDQVFSSKGSLTQRRGSMSASSSCSEVRTTQVKCRSHKEEIDVAFYG
jgi:hypothetical protein